MATSQPWRCTNPDCRSMEIPETRAPVEGQSLRCSCGAPMKKSYTSPVFHYLDFLRDEAKPEVPEPVVHDGPGE